MAVQSQPYGRGSHQAELDGLTGQGGLEYLSAAVRVRLRVGPVVSAIDRLGRQTSEGSPIGFAAACVRRYGRCRPWPYEAAMWYAARWPWRWACRAVIRVSSPGRIMSGRARRRRTPRVPGTVRYSSTTSWVSFDLEAQLVDERVRAYPDAPDQRACCDELAIAEQDPLARRLPHRHAGAYIHTTGTQDCVRRARQPWVELGQDPLGQIQQQSPRPVVTQPGVPGVQDVGA